jgi:radical SAM superfamily enzyme with C-terminal helix-hairpin-helix motif
LDIGIWDFNLPHPTALTITFLAIFPQIGGRHIYIQNPFREIMLITLIDGYTDEPSCLGVPPYIAPYPRYLWGAVKDAGHDLNYLTIDEFRMGSEKSRILDRSQMLIIYSGTIVPGKYLRGSPISYREITEIARRFDCLKVLGGSAVQFGFGRGGGKRAWSSDEIGKYFDYISRSDLDACIFDYLTEQEFSDRTRTGEEHAKWSIKGAELVTSHPDFPQPLIAELEASRGCVRYYTGGCSFCSEPEFGVPEFRSPEDIIQEFKALYNYGVRNFRLGAQSCIFSYYAKGIGETETPRPNPGQIKRLFEGIRSAAPDLNVLHLDNANPAIISEHPVESKKIIKLIIEYCTSGNVLSFGMESADPEVIKANNLNSNPDEIMAAIKMVNKYGSLQGPNGMPVLLPGLNFVLGLKGESKTTYELNFEFLRSVLNDNLLLRRINLRQVLILNKARDEGYNTKKYHKLFVKFKKRVRDEIDNEMLKRLMPPGTILWDAFVEKVKGNLTYARQIGTYPLLIGIPYKLDLTERFIDVTVTSHGQRSITAIEYPFKLNHASLKALEALPGVGKKRAARIIRGRPFKNIDEFRNVLDEPELAIQLEDLLAF